MYTGTYDLLEQGGTIQKFSQPYITIGRPRFTGRFTYKTY